MRKKISLVFCAIMVLTFSLGCSLITDFPDESLEPDTETETESDSFPYSLESNITGDIEVALNDDDTAQANIFLDTPLPGDDSDDATIISLIGVTLNLEIRNNQTGVTANIKDGTRVTSKPDSPGEYQLNLTSMRDELQIEFYNETVQGQTLYADGDYDARISVTPNSYFAVESFERDVTVVTAVP